MCLIVFKGQLLMLPVIEAAIDIVEKSGGQYHVLLIIADGLVEFKVLLFALSLSLELTNCCMHTIFLIWSDVLYCVGYKKQRYK